MTAALFARVPRLAVLVAVALLGTATLALAARSTVSPPPATVASTPVAAPQPLVVPDVRRQAYVFAKGSLEQAGFSWRVEGSIRGYAANIVASQTPAPGTKVVAAGAPTIVLRLDRNPSYKQEGLPEDVSPYAGRPVRLFGASKPKPAHSRPARKPLAVAAASAPKPATKAVVKKTPAKIARTAARKPAFVEPGAPAEPLDEITLAARAKRLDTWLEATPKPTRRDVNYWLYQHNWIVTGASFGWSGGVEALRTLIAVDGRVQKLWGIGSRSEQLARSTLVAVQARSK